MNLSNGDLQEFLIFPSVGDNGYPSLVLKKGVLEKGILEDDMLYVSYYSSHEDNKICVYLAEINLNTLINNKVLVT
ncbi:hypothetical protein [Paraglaciecola psychrophila]|nr:hypothetical protein [Paraglaciecola psychrophila]